IPAVCSLVLKLNVRFVKVLGASWWNEILFRDTRVIPVPMVTLVMLTVRLDADVKLLVRFAYSPVRLMLPVLLMVRMMDLFPRLRLTVTVAKVFGYVRRGEDQLLSI